MRKQVKLMMLFSKYLTCDEKDTQERSRRKRILPTTTADLWIDEDIDHNVLNVEQRLSGYIPALASRNEFAFAHIAALYVHGHCDVYSEASLGADRFTLGSEPLQ